jgi:hypothetical protein
VRTRAPPPSAPPAPSNGRHDHEHAAATRPRSCHLSLAWAYLQRDGFPEGALNFRRHLKTYVANVGAEGKYHETLTWAYLVLLNEELSLRSPPGESFDALIQRRPDLLDHRNGAIARRYSKAQLDSPDARRVFILPVQEG